MTHLVVAGVCQKAGFRLFTYYSAWGIQQELKQYEHSGKVFSAINKQQFKARNIVDPAQEFILVFESFIGALDECIRKNTSENHTFAQTYYLWFPNLMDSEIRLTNPKRVVESQA